MLDTVGVLARTSGEVTLRPVWMAQRGLSNERGALGDLLAERGVRPPW